MTDPVSTAPERERVTQEEKQISRYASRKWRGFVGLCILWTVGVFAIPFVVDGVPDIASLTTLATAWREGAQVLCGIYCTANVLQFIGGGFTVNGRPQ